MRRALWFLLIGIVSCGDTQDGAAPDAALGMDAAPDAAPDAALATATGSCSVLVYDTEGLPVQGATLVVRTASASLIGEASTDELGFASREDCQDGGMMTVARILADEVSLSASTYFDVPLGTTIQVGQLQEDPPVVTPAFRSTVAPPPPDTDIFVATIGCQLAVFNAANGAFFEDLTTACLNQGSVDLLVSATSAGQPSTAFDWILGTAPVDDAATEAGAAPAWKDAEPVTMVLDDVPEAQITVQQELSVLRGGLAFHTLASTTRGGSSIGTFEVETTRPPAGFADGLRWMVEVRSPNSATGMVSTESATASSLMRSVDDLMPAVLGLLGGGDPESPTMQWSADGDLSSANMAAIYLRWRAGTGTHRHAVFFPGGSRTSITAPPLPAAFSDTIRPIGIPLESSAAFLDHEDASYIDFLEAGRRPPVANATSSLLGSGAYRITVSF